MDTFLIKAAQLILAFAILVIIHEFGHFLFARIFGVRVEKFYIFFDPWKEIFKWKPGKYYGFFGKTKKLKGAYENPTDSTDNKSADKAPHKNKKSFWGDTEYGIGWLPLGGYCKISGMIDESMDTEQMQAPPQPHEFRTKPAWQRLLIMVAGVLFNFLLAIVIYAGLVYSQGEEYVPFENAKNGMVYSGEARKIGFHNGDIPLTADGKKLDNPGEARMLIAQARKVSVLRDGRDTVEIAIPSDFLITLDNEMRSDTARIAFMNYSYPAKITQIAAGEGAAKAGLKVDDRIIGINSEATPSLFEFFDKLKGHDNQTVDLKILRTENAVTDTLTVPVSLSETSKMGIGLETNPGAFYDTKMIKYGLFESIPRGISMGTEQLTNYAKSMKMVFTKEGAKQIGGFGTIGSIFPDSWNWIAFWNIAAFLSVALAFMNILPIPALDGGHVLFLLFEVITGRKPSDKFLERAQVIGMVLLLGLLIYANGMDIVRLFIK